MKNVIKEYIEYSDKEKKDLWENAIFVFDTNVLLNLYRYSNNTRKQLINAISKLKPRIWMPYQVAYEFCKDRYKVLDESNRRFDDIEKDANKLADDWKNALRLDKNDSDLNDLVSYLEKWISNKKKKNYQIFDPSNDDIFNTVLDLFEGKAGEKITNEKLNQIEEEGKVRFANKMPPGYKDEKKAENKYGDLLVWKEILEYAKENDVDIIYITHDQKEDWWNLSHGKTIGPRIELRKEFFDYTGKRFHMYTMTSFLEVVSNTKEKSIDATTMNEVELLTLEKKRERKNRNRIRKTASFDNYESAEEIISRIEHLENKNAKRRAAIVKLEEKQKREKLSSDSMIALKHNRENYERDEEIIAILNEKLLLMNRI